MTPNANSSLGDNTPLQLDPYLLVDPYLFGIRKESGARAAIHKRNRRWLLGALATIPFTAGAPASVVFLFGAAGKYVNELRRLKRKDMVWDFPTSKSGKRAIFWAGLRGALLSAAVVSVAGAAGIARWNGGARYNAADAAFKAGAREVRDRLDQGQIFDCSNAEGAGNSRRCDVPPVTGYMDYRRFPHYFGNGFTQLLWRWNSDIGDDLKSLLQDRSNLKVSMTLRDFESLLQYRTQVGVTEVCVTATVLWPQAVEKPVVGLSDYFKGTSIAATGDDVLTASRRDIAEWYKNFRGGAGALPVVGSGAECPTHG